MKRYKVENKEIAELLALGCKVTSTNNVIHSIEAPNNITVAQMEVILPNKKITLEQKLEVVK